MTQSEHEVTEKLRVAQPGASDSAPGVVAALVSHLTAMAQTTSRNLGRLSEIAQVAVRHGFGYFLERQS